MTMPQYRRCEATYNGETVKLSPLATELLLIFLLRQGDVLDRDFLCDCLWPDPDIMPEYWSTVFGYVIRKVREAVPGTIFTIGYRGFIMDKPEQRLIGLP